MQQLFLSSFTVRISNWKTPLSILFLYDEETGAQATLEKIVQNVEKVQKGDFYHGTTPYELSAMLNNGPTRLTTARGSFCVEDFAGRAEYVFYEAVNDLILSELRESYHQQHEMLCERYPEEMRLLNSWLIEFTSAS